MKLMDKTAEISTRLRRLNVDLVSENDKARVVGFKSWFDEDLAQTEVSVLWELETPSKSGWPLERTDFVCQRAFSALKDLDVANVYCAYRTFAEPADDDDKAYWPFPIIEQAA
jgi:hypothetical protein